MRTYRKLATMAFAIFLSLIFTVPTYSVTNQELNALPKHYTDITFDEVFTRCFSKDARGRYSMKGERPILLLFTVRGCRPCIAARYFLNWMIDYRKDSKVDYYWVYIKDDVKDYTPLENLAKQFGIPSNKVNAVPIIMLFNQYGNLVFSCCGFPMTKDLPFYKSAEQTPEWKNFNTEGSHGQDIIDLLKAYENL